MADRYILAVESSCDETSVAVLKNEKELLSNIIASQVESHKRFGGVVPEVASRHHVEVVTLCIKDALSEAGITAEQLDAVAVPMVLVWSGRSWSGWQQLRPSLGHMGCL